MSQGRRRYLLGRLLQSLLTLLIIVTITFVIFRLLPGDPAAALLDPHASAEQKALLAERLGLNQPPIQQYLTYLRGLLMFDFGRSYSSQQSVLTSVWPAFANTLVLVVFSTLFSYSLGVVLGALMAWRRGTWVDSAGTTFALIFRSAPPFWIGLMAIVLFSFKWPLFPIGGLRSAGYEASGLLGTYLTLDFLHHAALPVLVASLYFLGLPALLMRASMLEVIGEDFIDLVRAKGVSETRVLFRHVVRNAALPVFTQATSHVGWAMGGLVSVEYIFSWPGLGQLLVNAVHTQDYPLAQGALLFIAMTVVAMNLIADFLYSYIDPRVDLM